MKTRNPGDIGMTTRPVFGFVFAPCRLDAVRCTSWIASSRDEKRPIRWRIEVSFIMRATIELYDSVKAGKGHTYFRHNATLYTPQGGAPSAEQAINAMVTDALLIAKESGVRYWHNSVRIAQILVVRSSEDAPLRLFPVRRTVPTSRFLWRIFLLSEEGQYKLAGYKLAYKDKVLHRLTPLTAEDATTEQEDGEK